MCSSLKWSSILGASLALMPLISVVAPAKDDLGFRVENQVFVEDEEEPRTRSTTIFYENVVYDFLESPKEITVFDRASDRVVLLDPIRKIRTELKSRDLVVVAERLRTWAAGQPNDLLRFSANPDFQKDYDSSTGELHLTSPWLSYDVTTIEPSRRELLSQYLKFCDFYCLLNTRLNPGTRPPFARMELNETLESLGRMPREVRLTLRPKGDNFLAEKMSAKSEHHVVPHLLESDRSRVAQTDEFMAIFRPLPFQEYQARVQPTR